MVMINLIYLQHTISTFKKHRSVTTELTKFLAGKKLVWSEACNIDHNQV